MNPDHEPKTDFKAMHMTEAEKINEFLVCAKGIELRDAKLPADDHFALCLSLMLEEMTECAGAGGKGVYKAFGWMLVKQGLKILFAKAKVKVEKSLTDYLDACIDMRWIVGNFVYYASLSKYWKPNFDEVYKANMSKFPTSRAEAEKSVEWYKAKGIATWASNAGINRFAILRVPDGKILKPAGWKAPEIKV